MKKNTGSNLRRITAASIMAALIFVVTWTIKMPVPSTSGGYLNFGDIVIYMTAYILGGPAAAMAAAVGSALADTAVGASAYILPTFIIKGAMGIVCGQMMKSGRFPAYAAACVVGGAIMTAGYGLYELAFFGSAYALAALPFNLIQWAGGAGVGIILYPVVVQVSKALALSSGSK